MESEPHPPIDAATREAAARWVVRRDRGLSEAEAAEFARWLAGGGRRPEAVERAGVAWAALDEIPVSARRPAREPGRRGLGLLGPAGLAAAALAGIVFFQAFPRASFRSASPGTPVPRIVEPQILRLADGTVVRLNTGSEVREEFTPAERRVVLVRGEAHFTVTHNPARPFIVRAGTVEVRAVGTAFNVNLRSAAVEVLVTEGRVRVDRPAELPAARAATAVPILGAGQRAVVPLRPAAAASDVVVSELDGAEIDRALAWQDPLLHLGGATLADLAAEFRRRSGARLVLADAELATMHVGGRFRADDIDGFVRVLEDNYGIEARRAPDGALVLSRAR